MKIVPFYYDDYDDLFANTYVLIDSDNNAIIIDPSKDYDGLINYINKRDIHLKAILLTHGHVDHMRGVSRLINAFSIPFYIGFEEVDFLTSPILNVSQYLGKEFVIKEKPLTVADKEVLHILNEDIICIHTPYHTIGSYCYLLNDSKMLFTGDFLFSGGVGRSDLPTGSSRDFPSSIAKILALDSDIKIYPGHGGSSTIENEKKYNPYLK